MSEEKKSFWARLFSSSRPSAREERVLEYLVHRMNEGVPLREAVDDEYVRRNLSRSQIEDIRSDPRLVEAARQRMQEAFNSGELNPDERPR